MTDSRTFANILSTQACAHIWSDETRTHYHLEFEKNLAIAQAKLGIIPQNAADLIVAACTTAIIDWPTLQAQTELIGYPVLPAVKQLVAHVNHQQPGLGEWAHYGATTQDVTDTATVLQLRDTLALLESSLDGIIAALVPLCTTHKATPMAARSHLQQAVPMSFGFKLARLLATFRRHRARLLEVRARLLVLEFGGAAGTLATLSPSGLDDVGFHVQDALAELLGLQSPDIAWHSERDSIGEVGHFMALVTATCSKFATDLKLLMQTEIGEAREPYLPERGASSTMPQKRNPISSAYINAMAATVRQLSASLCEAMVDDHERGTGPWEMEFIILPQICPLAHATLEQTRLLLEGLEVDEAAMKRNLDMSNGAIVSEAVMMGLAPTVGRQKAHDLVYDLCREAAVKGTPLLDLLDASPEIPLERAELQRLCEPANYLGLSEKMTQRVLNLVKRG